MATKTARGPNAEGEMMVNTGQYQVSYCCTYLVKEDYHDRSARQFIVYIKLSY